MYIPASSTTASSFLQQYLPASAAPSTYTSTVTVENRNCYRNPAFSLKLQSGGRNVLLGQKKKPLPLYTPPAVIRKDSGEVVRPCLRKRSATTNDLTAYQASVSSSSNSGDQSPIPAGMRTPRFVHFGADLEYVRWFLKAQSPRSASKDAVPDYFSASEDEHSSSRRATPVANTDTKPTTVRLTSVRRPSPSFTLFEESPVVVERVELADNRRSSAALRGTVKVHNIAFEKCVSVRYSFDQWRTAEETTASYIRTLLDSQGSRPGIDRFAFTIALPPSLLAASLPATVAICVRYSVAGSEHWDNNNGSNYIFKISQPAVPAIVDDEADYDGIMINNKTTTAAAYDVMSAGGAHSAADLCAPRRLTFGQANTSPSSPPSPSLQPHSFRAPTAADTRRYMAQSAALFGLSSRHQQQKQSAGGCAASSSSSAAAAAAESPSVTPLLPGSSGRYSAAPYDTAADIRNDSCHRRASLPSISSSPRMQLEQPLLCEQRHEQLPLYQEVAWREGRRGRGEDLSPYATSSSALPASIVTSARFADTASAHAVEYLSSSNDSTPSSSPILSSSASLPSFGTSENSAVAAAAGTSSSSLSSTSLPTSMMRTGSPLGHVVFDADGSIRTSSPLVWSHSNTATSVLQC
ncbi:hypothetical protein EV178_002630 [Coemansia sp. RSA 1646]|nr:hypothetical protein EV178_002630 [Coemansia sp. RSA 1646]